MPGALVDCRPKPRPRPKLTENRGPNIYPLNWSGWRWLGGVIWAVKQATRRERAIFNPNRWVLAYSSQGGPVTQAQFWVKNQLTAPRWSVKRVWVAGGVSGAIWVFKRENSVNEPFSIEIDGCHPRFLGWSQGSSAVGLKIDWRPLDRMCSGWGWISKVVGPIWIANERNGMNGPFSAQIDGC